MTTTRKVNYSSVPSSIELDSNHPSRKYTVNPSTNKLLISKSLCCLMVLGAIILAILCALLVFLFTPKCPNGTPKSSNNQLFISDKPIMNNEEIDTRLPVNLEPLFYKLDIVPDFKKLMINGKVAISIRVNEETYEIIFNVKNLLLNQSSIKLRSISNESIPIDNFEQLPSERYKIVTKTSLKTNGTYVLDIEYSTNLNQHLLGIYNSRYVDENNGKAKMLISTQFSPIDARKAFPCFDEPSFKSIFRISIARPEYMNTISNTKRKDYPENFEGRDGWVWDHFEDTPRIPTYLVAFVISEFESVNSSRTSTKLWSRQSLLPQTQYAAFLTTKIINFMENYLKVDFPYEKLDLVAVPEFGYGAMENYGLITFRESMLLFDSNNTSIEDQKNIAHILAHELAHQWFGNLVTPKWWDDLWLKEGFATYFSYLAVEDIHPDWTYSQEIVPYETMKALMLDSYKFSEAISAPIKNNKKIRQNFDGTSYPKGASLVRMMHHFLTTPTFTDGLKNYLGKYKFKNANHTDLFDCFDEVVGKFGNSFSNRTTVREIMQNWVEKPGFPVLNIRTNPDNKSITLHQKRFLLDGGIDDTLWWIPISVATDLEPYFHDATPKAWMNSKTHTIPINFKEWYLINVNQTGYYMVNYDESNWYSLIKNIMNVPPLTRAQLISDSMELAKAKMIDYDIPLRLISNMAVNDENIMFVPTLVAFEKLEFLSDMLVNTPVFGMFEKYHLTIFKNTYDIVDFSTTSNDYLSLRIMKTVLEWSCRSSESRCAILAHNIYRRWMQKTMYILPNIRHIVYCTAIRQGGQPEWDFAYGQYRSTNSPTEKNVLLDALGCTKHEWLLSRYLNIVLDDETYSMRIQDADRIFESIANNKVGSQLAFDFLRRNWNELKDHLGEGFNILNKLILSLPKHMNTEFQLAELQKFKQEVGDGIGSAGPALDKAIEIVRTKVIWMQKNYKSLEQWLFTHRDKFDY